MPVLVSKTRVQGASVVTTLPSEVVRRLAIPVGQELAWIEDGLGGFRAIIHTSESDIADDAHVQIMREYDGAFRRMASGNRVSWRGEMAHRRDAARDSCAADRAIRWRPRGARCGRAARRGSSSDATLGG